MNKLKKLRTEQKLTIRDLELKLNINRASLNRMENETQGISDEYLRIFSAFYKVSSDYILGLSNERNPKNEDAQPTQTKSLIFRNREEERVWNLIKQLKYISSLKNVAVLLESLIAMEREENTKNDFIDNSLVEIENHDVFKKNNYN